MLYCHRPDPHTPIEETARTMNSLIERGLVLYWGTSEWSAVQILEAIAICEKLNLIPPTMEQPEYSMFARDRVEKEYKNLYPNLGLTTWSPLKFGILTGKYNSGVAPEGSRAVKNQNLQYLLSSIGNLTMKRSSNPLYHRRKNLSRKGGKIGINCKITRMHNVPIGYSLVLKQS